MLNIWNMPSTKLKRVIVFLNCEISFNIDWSTEQCNNNWPIAQFQYILAGETSVRFQPPITNLANKVQKNKNHRQNTSQPSKEHSFQNTCSQNLASMTEIHQQPLTPKYNKSGWPVPYIFFLQSMQTQCDQWCFHEPLHFCIQVVCVVRDKQAQLNSQSLLFNFWVSHWFTTRRLSTNNPASSLIRKLDTMSSAEAFKIFHHKVIVLSKHFIKNLAMNTELEN